MQSQSRYRDQCRYASLCMQFPIFMLTKFNDCKRARKQEIETKRFWKAFGILIFYATFIEPHKLSFAKSVSTGMKFIQRRAKCLFNVQNQKYPNY